MPSAECPTPSCCPKAGPSLSATTPPDDICLSSRLRELHRSHRPEPIPEMAD